MYYGKNGWYPQLALRRRFKLNGVNEEAIAQLLKEFFKKLDYIGIMTGTLVKPERDGENYYAHITAEYDNKFVIPAEEYTDKRFPLNNVWLLKDAANENSVAFIKIK